MIEIGRVQELKVLRSTSIGVFLGQGDEAVLLPRKVVPAATGIGDPVSVFVYHDSEGRPIATTLRPAATVGGIAVMEVVDLSPHGAFVDWGLEKDLFVPTVEQHRPMRVGTRHVVEVRVDDRTDRMIGSSRLGRFFDPDVEHLQPGREVELLVWSFNDVGAQVVVEGRYSGLVYASETHGDLQICAELRGYVDRVRDDGKIDISLRKRGRAAEIDAQAVILNALQASDGFLALHDKSTPKDITRRLDLSKRVFKAAVGGLYKRGLIELGPGGIQLKRG